MITKVTKFNLVLLVFLFNRTISHGQFALTETGFTIGGGTSLLMSSGSSKIYPGFSAGGFFSHYTCGKRFGFHGELEWRGMMGSAPKEWVVSDLPDKNPNISFHSIEPGFYFKLRPHTYHRPKESGILIGPRAAFIIIGSAQYNVWLDPQTIPSFFVPGFHLSGWIRRPFGSDDGSFFIRPGVNVYFTPVLSYKTTNPTPAEFHYMNYYLFLQIGVRLWNDR